MNESGKQALDRLFRIFEEVMFRWSLDSISSGKWHDGEPESRRLMQEAKTLYNVLKTE